MKYLFTLVLLLGFSLPVGAQDYLADLQAAARSAHLASDPQWRALLHYESSLVFRSLRSVADDPGFFNASDGKINPQAELDATLARFFDTKLISPVDQLPQCRFAARYHWLKQQLAFDSTRLPEQDCPRLKTWFDALNPASATLIFPSAYVNSPATMFGHTLLRIDAQSSNEQTRLLDYAINYAAEATDTNGFTFAFKGLTGMYPGVMSNSPYYKKVREYSDMESRDIWEYQLTLTKPEIEQLLRHAWELSATHFDYYFFDENCSYLLLTLIDVARPGLNLAQKFPLAVIPADTVKAVVETPDLVSKVVFRPSTGTELTFRAKRLNQQNLADAVAITEGRKLPASLSQSTGKAEILEFSDRLLSFRGQAGKIDEADGLPRLHAIQIERSRLPVLDMPVIPEPVRPESGHASARADLYAGYFTGKAAVSVQMHPAYHELLDQEDGYSRGAQIRFGDVRLIQRTGENGQLVHFLPVDIVSLTPRNDWYTAPSWKVRFGWERALGYEQALAPMIAGGPGVAWDAGGIMSYVLLENQILAQRDLARGWAVGSGALAGAFVDVTSALRVQTEASHQWFAVSHWQKTQTRLKLRQSMGKADNLVFSAEWNRVKTNGLHKEEGGVWLGWQRYF